MNEKDVAAKVALDPPTSIDAKWIQIFEESVADLFGLARNCGVRLTPDQAMAELDDALESALAKARVSEAGKDSAHAPHPPLRLDAVAFRRKIHRRAVDMYYNTYFPRKPDAAGKPRRGGSRLSDEHLDLVLSLAKQGLTLREIAKRLGYSDAKFGSPAKDRVRKQIDIAVRRWNEIVTSIRQHSPPAIGPKLMTKPEKRRSRNQHSRGQKAKGHSGK